MTGAIHHARHSHRRFIHRRGGRHHGQNTRPTGGVKRRRHAVHNSFKNDGPHRWNVHASNFSNYFRELAAIVRTTGGPPDHDEWTSLYARYDSTFRDGASANGPRED